ncbi:hypothetical protein AVEN_220220-1 [Araneus ventricosus]|uniref:Uncharacterized protein n=1 Tax=Araneus ventricosus TaxID=182803 RepID=A0A4Y2UGW7_ARAVE|nr:hypothetical protein AVEN_220220-1 [Araneus ventricosus]
MSDLACTRIHGRSSVKMYFEPGTLRSRIQDFATVALIRTGAASDILRLPHRIWRIVVHKAGDDVGGLQTSKLAPMLYRL